MHGLLLSHLTDLFPLGFPSTFPPNKLIFKKNLFVLIGYT